MGTDIHGVFQSYDSESKQWRDVPSNYEQDRHYQLFAVLADVRNGYGFAGITTGEIVKPIAERRGFPLDFLIVDEDQHPVELTAHIDPRRRQYRDPEDDLSVWMGDHSHSWLSGEEMLAWYAAAPSVTKTGILGRDAYAEWDGVSEPSSYCGGVSGGDIIVINDNAIEKESKSGWNHIRCHWESKLGGELSYFFDEVQRLVHEHGKVRFVFGFDS